jgi:hypothetical protein
MLIGFNCALRDPQEFENARSVAFLLLEKALQKYLELLDEASDIQVKMQLIVEREPAADDIKPFDIVQSKLIAGEELLS